MAKLQHASEINDLFHASPLEDLLWQSLKTDGVEAERGFFVPGDRNRRYELDFAIFGQARNLDIECDGDQYHLDRERARYDNHRNNFLTARGWSVLRYTTQQLRGEMPDVLQNVRAAIRDCGGLAHAEPRDAIAFDPLWQPALWAASLATGHTVDPHKKASPRRRRR
jgi:very-short-patch-repair endonuclease